MPQFTLKVDLGHIITVLVLLITLAIAWGRFDNQIDTLSQKMETIESNQKNMTQKLDSVRDEQVRNSTRLDDIMRK